MATGGGSPPKWPPTQREAIFSQITDMLKKLHPDDKQVLISELVADDSGSSSSEYIDVENVKSEDDIGPRVKLERGYSERVNPIENMTRPPIGRGILSASFRASGNIGPNVTRSEGQAPADSNCYSKGRGAGGPPMRSARHSTPAHVRNIQPIGAERSHRSASFRSNATDVNSRYFMSQPRLPSFSGDKKSEVSYRQWRAETKGLLNDVTLPLPNITTAIRRSLKGMAAECLIHYGDEINPYTLLEDFDKWFGEVLTSEQVLAKFYSAAQEADETVAAWGCRLKEMLSRCPDDLYRVGRHAEAILREKFWSGLRVEKVKAAIRHRYDTGDDFNKLLVTARAVEQEGGPAKAKPISQLTSKSTASEVDNLALILEKITQLETELKAVKKSQARETAKTADKNDQSRSSYTCDTKEPGGSRFKGTCFYCKRVGHKVQDCFKLKKKEQEGLNEVVPVERGSHVENQ